MDFKTPKFNILLDEVLKDIVPHKRICKWKGEHSHCEGEFEINNEDITFLKMLKVPPPNFCPTCRRIRRTGYMGILQLFKRACDAPEHSESMISIFPAECPFPVYDYKYFIGEEFDPFSYGVEYQADESPVEVLYNLRKIFPVPSFLNRDPGSVNSEYSNGGRSTKNVYYAGGCFYSENVWYSSLVNKSKDVMDSRDLHKADHVYACMQSDNLYKTSFVYSSKDCTDSMFLFDCRNTNECFGCVGLRNAKHCVWNQQLSPDEYKEFMQSIYPLTREKIKDFLDKFKELIKTKPINASMNIGCENVDGVSLENCKNLSDVNLAENSENVRHADGLLSHNTSMDVLFSGGNSSLLYSSVNVGSQSSHVKFSAYCKFCTNSEFIFNCKNVDNCFMCFGLQDKSYCILNKQYSKEEYHKIVDEIKVEMMKRGEYADGVGLEFSPQPYNFSHGTISYPLPDEQIIKLGGFIASDPDINIGDMHVVSVADIPKTIEDTTDDILNVAIKCSVSGRSFKIIASELEFLRKMKIPIPEVHPSIRIKNLFSSLPLGIKYRANCNKCNKEMYSLFNPKDGYNLYCEKCYQQEVY